MKIQYILENEEKQVTPIAIAKALIEDETLTKSDLSELRLYLYAYTTTGKDLRGGSDEM